MARATDAGHTYELDNVDGGVQVLQFIRKEESKEQPGKLETMINGTTNEAVLDVLIDRLNFLYEKLPDDFTKNAIMHLEAALQSLKDRTADREARSVEGTNQA